MSKKKRVGEGWELERALDPRLGYGKRYHHIAKSDLRKIFAKDAKILRLSQKYSKTNCGQVVNNKSSDFFLCLFGVVKATKFRNSSEYSDCICNVRAKSCLPFDVNQFDFLRSAKRPRYELSATFK